MLIRFSYLKMVSPKQRVFAPSSAVTTFVDGNSKIDPLGGTGVNAPSTLITDEKGNQYYVAKAFSTVNAVITAVTSTETNISLL
jgi:hypothetical protein